MVYPPIIPRFKSVFLTLIELNLRKKHTLNSPSFIKPWVVTRKFVEFCSLLLLQIQIREGVLLYFVLVLFCQVAIIEILCEKDWTSFRICINA